MKANTNTMAGQIYRNAISYHRNQIRFYVGMARQDPALRTHMLERAREEAGEIQKELADWEESQWRAGVFAS